MHISITIFGMTYIINFEIKVINCVHLVQTIGQKAKTQYTHHLDILL